MNLNRNQSVLKFISILAVFIPPSSFALSPPQHHIYQGEMGGVKIALETSAAGSALMIVNNNSEDLVIDPTKLLLTTNSGMVRVCSLTSPFIVSLEKTTSTQVVKANSRAGYIIGGCPRYDSQGSYPGPLLIYFVTKIAIDEKVFKVRLSEKPL